jgi:sulfofructose kinase
MGPTYDVCALGCVCWDMLGTVAHYPALDEKASIGEFTQQGGGRAGTAAAAVAALGGKAAVFAHIGDDEFGRHITREFDQLGVNYDGLAVHPGQSSQFAFCVSHPASAQRTIFYKHESMPRMRADDTDLAALTDCRCLLIDTHHPDAALAAAQRAREKGLPVVLDAERPDPHLADFFALSDYIIVPANLVMALADSDEALGREPILRHKPAALVITRGAAGADMYRGDDLLHQPAFPVPQVIDTTGAGDVFHGAFAYMLALGRDAPECLAYASASAALSTTALGGRGHLPSMAQVKALVTA